MTFLLFTSPTTQAHSRKFHDKGIRKMYYIGNFLLAVNRKVSEKNTQGIDACNNVYCIKLFHAKLIRNSGTLHWPKY